MFQKYSEVFLWVSFHKEKRADKANTKVSDTLRSSEDFRVKLS